jgi:hypothetical protein
MWSPDVCAVIGAASTFTYDDFSVLRLPSLCLAILLTGLRVISLIRRRIVYVKPWYMPQGERRRCDRKCAHRRRKSDQYLTYDLHFAKAKLLLAITVVLIPRVKF